jgi:aldehyde:ferredoxin oxidoreductase
VQGLDVMSTGVALAWATEATAQGLISERETDGMTPRWGDAQTYIEMTRRIVGQPTDFYRAVARGVDHAASIYGGSDFALAFGGNEMPGYHTGPGCHAGYLTGARHSHLDSAGYGPDQKAAATGETLAPRQLAEMLVEEERWRQVLTSLVICLFARGIYTSDVVRDALKTVGFEWSDEQLSGFGAETLRRKIAFKEREGFDQLGVRIPGRILETPAPGGHLTEEMIRETVRLVQELR